MAREAAKKRNPPGTRSADRLRGTDGLNPGNGSEGLSGLSQVGEVDPSGIKWDPALDGLRDLPANWDSYGAEPPNDVAVSALRRILLQVSQVGLEPTKIVPSSEGGAAVCFVRADKYADVECFNNCDVLAVTSGDGQDPEAWEVGVESAAVERTLEKIRVQIRA